MSTPEQPTNKSEAWNKARDKAIAHLTSILESYPGFLTEPLKQPIESLKQGDASEAIKYLENELEFCENSLNDPYDDYELKAEAALARRSELVKTRDYLRSLIETLSQ